MAHPKQIDAARILDAALQLLEEFGSAGLSLRGVAARLEVKAPSIYHYFEDRSALERGLIAEGRRLLLEWLRRHARVSEPEAAFREMAEAYLRFARRRPALYFFVMDFQVAGHNPPCDPGKQLWNLVLHRVGALSGDPDDTAGAVAAWAFLHGFAVLEKSGQFGKSGPKNGFDRGLEALVLGFKLHAKDYRKSG